MATLDLHLDMAPVLEAVEELIRLYDNVGCRFPEHLKRRIDLIAAGEADDCVELSFEAGTFIAYPGGSLIAALSDARLAAVL